MTLNREGSFIHFDCDGHRCWEVFEAETYDFHLAKDRLKEAGWGIMHRVDWEHYCPSCFKVEKEKAAAKLQSLAAKLNGDNS